MNSYEDTEENYSDWCDFIESEIKVSFLRDEELEDGTKIEYVD